MQFVGRAMACDAPGFSFVSRGPTERRSCGRRASRFVLTGRDPATPPNKNNITQWGRGEVGTDGFDFGQGNVSTDFVGSTAVDDDGFICVADVRNGRIQKFAP